MQEQRRPDEYLQAMTTPHGPALSEPLVSDWGFGLLFNAIKDAVIVADANTGRIVLWNRGA